MLLGMPYKGSKGKLVLDFMDHFGCGENFFDVFGGGGSVSHAVSERFASVHYNEADSRIASAFKQFVSGTVGPLPFVSREDFKVKAKADGVIAICYSFGTGTRTYGYGQDIEPWKQAMHCSLLENDNSMFEDMGIKVVGEMTSDDISKNFEEVRTRYEAWFREVFRDSFPEKTIDRKMRAMWLRSECSFSRTEHVQRYRRMLQLKDNPIRNITVTSMDYRDLEIPDGAVVYCDPPYEDTEQYENTGYKNATFRKDLFVEWCRSMAGRCDVFVSEQTMPDDFVCVWEKQVRNVYNGQKKHSDRVERLFRLNRPF